MSQNSASLDALFGPVAVKPDGSEVLAALTAAARERILIPVSYTHLTLPTIYSV